MNVTVTVTVDDSIANMLLAQWLKSDFLSVEDTRTRFAYAESLVRLCLARAVQSNIIDNVFKPVLQFLFDVNHTHSESSNSTISTSATHSTSTGNQRCTMSVILLVLARFNRSSAFDWSSKHYSEDNQRVVVLSPDECKLILPLLLQLLREKNPLTQDMCSMAICHLFDAAVLMELNAKSNGPCLSDYISDEVTTILSREKKLSQPAGRNISND